MDFFGLPRMLVWLIAISVLVRLLLFGFLALEGNPEYFIHGDSNGYMRLADNILAGNGYTQMTEPPYLPDSVRTPGFPLILAATKLAFNSFTAVIFLQILLSIALVFLAYRLCLLVSGKETLALIAAGLMAFEPYSIYINLSVLTDTWFATLLLSGTYVASRFIRAPTLWSMALASALFGLAALFRPIGQFLPIVLVFLVLLRMAPREYAKYIAVAIIPFLIVVGPWLARNEIVFGVPALSSSGLQNAYSDLGGAIISYRDRIPSWVAKQRLEEDFSARYGSNIITIQQDLSYAPQLFKEALGIMFSNPVETTKALTSITIAFFTHDMWLYYPQRWELVPRYDITFSPSYVLMTEGPAVAFHKVVEEAGSTLVVPISGRLFWIAVVLLFFIGTGTLILRGGEGRIHALFLLALVLYLLALTASVGFGINGRFRYPVNALFFTGAAIGGSIVLHWLRTRFMSRRV